MAVVHVETVRHFVAVPAEVYRQVPEQRRRRPQRGQHRRHPAHGHPPLVAERVRHGHVAVDADAAQVKQRRGTEKHVVGVEEVADDRAERPASGENAENGRSANTQQFPAVWIAVPSYLRHDKDYLRFKEHMFRL